MTYNFHIWKNSSKIESQCNHGFRRRGRKMSHPSAPSHQHPSTLVTRPPPTPLNKVSFFCASLVPIFDKTPPFCFKLGVSESNSQHRCCCRHRCHGGNNLGNKGNFIDFGSIGLGGSNHLERRTNAGDAQEFFVQYSKLSS